MCAILLLMMGTFLLALELLCLQLCLGVFRLATGGLCVLAARASSRTIEAFSYNGNVWAVSKKAQKTTTVSKKLPPS